VYVVEINNVITGMVVIDGVAKCIERRVNTSGPSERD
jgi:hypothetical protein